MNIIKILFLNILLSNILYARSEKIKDPDIPDGEKIVYTLKYGNETSQMSEYTKIKIENNQEIYEIFSTSIFGDRTVKIRKKDMKIIYSKNLSKEDDSTIERTTVLLEDKNKTDNILLMDYSGLSYMLRGYDFSITEPLIIGLLGARGSYSTKITNYGKETLKIGNKEYVCYKIGMGLTGIMGAIFPKTYMWFNSEKPYYMIKYEGQMGPPGAPKIIMEIKEYSIEKNEKISQ